MIYIVQKYTVEAFCFHSFCEANIRQHSPVELVAINLFMWKISYELYEEIQNLVDDKYSVEYIMLGQYPVQVVQQDQKMVVTIPLNIKCLFYYRVFKKYLLKKHLSK